MPRTNEPLAVRIVRALDRLRRRREVEWLVLYLGAAWILYEAVGLTVDTFNLPVLVVRATAALLGLGAIFAAPLAHWYELTARALEKSGGADIGDVPGVPDVLESALTRSYRPVGGRAVLLVGAGSTLLFSGFFFLLWSAWAASHETVAPDARVSVLVFPFRAAGADAGGYGEGIADLLIVTLDGTPGVRVADPSSLWQKLRPKRSEPARDPDLEEAIALSRQAGAKRFVTGSVLPSGSRLDVTARVHETETGEVLASLTTNGHRDSLAAVVHRTAIELLAQVWEREQLPTVPEIERYATSNADALKAYLEAKSLVRRGLPQSALAAIERAVALDSTFALAHLEHFGIRSWVLFQNAEPYIGLREIIERAMRYRDRLTPRNRLRVEANLALDDTDGARAAFLFERILGIDSLDIDALNSLAFTYLRDGWQLKKGREDIVAAYERVLRADSGIVGADLQRAWLALGSGDSASAGQIFERLAARDSSPAVRGRVGALRALQAASGVRDSILRALAVQSVPVVTTVLRDLRALNPELAEGFCAELMNDSMPTFHQRVGSGARAQLWLAEGRLATVDSLVKAGELERVRPVVNRFFIASQLAGLGEAEATARSAEELARYAPAESLKAYLDLKPAVRATGWSVAAYLATFGDTAEARVWQRALQDLPQGNTWRDWTGSLSADVEARLAVRRGDWETAEREAQEAYELWTIHSNYAGESDPELAMRFHLAEILLAQGATERAAWLFRSFTPPYTWTGFYTARASFELGRIEEANGRREEALSYYLTATRLWERGEPRVVDAWLERAREGLRRVRAVEPLGAAF